MNESISSVLHRYFFTALIVLVALGTCPRAAEAQNAKTGPKKVSTNRKAGVAWTDVKRFRARLDSALAESHAEKAFWGILIVDRDNGETLYELNADKFVTPASNAKIFTTALAFSTLGPDFRFHTTWRQPGYSGRMGGLSVTWFSLATVTPIFPIGNFHTLGKWNVKVLSKRP